MIEEIAFKNLNNILKRKTDEDVQEAKQFYYNAHKEAKLLAEKYNKDLLHTSGVLAALSPMVRWEQNIRLAHKYFRGERKIHVRRQINKCYEILNTSTRIEVLRILSGLKTQNFFVNILDPDNENFVTIDRWMIRAIRNEDILSITPKQYLEYKEIFIKFAKRKRLHPVFLQALIWTIIRREDNFTQVKLKNKPKILQNV